MSSNRSPQLMSQSTAQPMTRSRRGPGPRRVFGALLALTLGLGLQALAVPSQAGTAAMAVQAGAGALAASLPVGTPQGALAPQGCSSPVAGQVTCELWAKTGSTSLLGQPMPIWGYAAAAGDAATAPGPLLVVTQNQVVHVVLHNQLPQATALAFPGQPDGSFGAGGSTGGPTAGIGNGAQATYTFTASRPGTFLYEAGHTPNGARQVALGLAGALVVLPASGNGAYDSDQSAYDDEAVLVLSELDPALNQAANPATFDLRQFDPRYRLINGRPFPSTDAVATGVGRTVLLRYVNVGALQHPMDLLGGTQLRLAQDAHPAPHPTTSLVADLAPGSTMDTLVAMPAGGGARLTLFEAGGHLNNNGMTEADPTLVANGGMMTFLDTAAPPPTDDLVGPVPSHLTASPSPADGTVAVVVTADVSDATTGGGTVANAELVVDDVVTQAPGFGLPMTGTFGTTTVHVTASIQPGTSNTPAYCAANPVTLSCLSAGKHRVFVRGLDAAGNWGVVSDVLLNLPKVGPLSKNGSVSPNPTNGQGGVDLSATGDDSGAGGNINQAEWSLDVLAAAGSGTPMAVNNGGTIAAVTAHVPQSALTGLAQGTHHLFVRVHDNLGLWGPELDVPFTLDVSGPTVVAADVAPNPTNGKLDDPGNPGNLVVSAVINDTAGGLVAGAEGFIDPGPTPTPGTGFKLIATDGRYDSASEGAYGLIPLSAITGLTEGNHRVVVRGRDNAGNWGQTYTIPLVVDRTSPTLGALSATPNPTNGAATVVHQRIHVRGRPERRRGLVRHDGSRRKGKGTPATISVNPAGTQVTVTVTVPPLTVGTRIVNIRVQDKAGNWSNARATTPDDPRRSSGRHRRGTPRDGLQRRRRHGLHPGRHPAHPGQHGHAGGTNRQRTGVHRHGLRHSSTVVPVGVLAQPQHAARGGQPDDHAVRRPHLGRQRQRRLRHPDAQHQRQRHPGPGPGRPHPVQRDNRRRKLVQLHHRCPPGDRCSGPRARPPARRPAGCGSRSTPRS